MISSTHRAFAPRGPATAGLVPAIHAFLSAPDMSDDMSDETPAIGDARSRPTHQPRHPRLAPDRAFPPADLHPTPSRPTPALPTSWPDLFRPSTPSCLPLIRPMKPPQSAMPGAGPRINRAIPAWRQPALFPRRICIQPHHAQPAPPHVMAGLVPAIHAFLSAPDMSDDMSDETPAIGDARSRPRINRAIPAWRRTALFPRRVCIQPHHAQPAPPHVMAGLVPAIHAFPSGLDVFDETPAIGDAAGELNVGIVWSNSISFKGNQPATGWAQPKPSPFWFETKSTGFAGARPIRRAGAAGSGRVGVAGTATRKEAPSHRDCC